MKAQINIFIFVSFLCIALVSCKKETATTEDKSSTIVYDENYLKTVKEFMSLMDNISEGRILKSDQYLNFDEAADKIEASINIKYCFPDEKISGSKTVDTIINILPDSTDLLKSTTVESLYNTVKQIIIFQLKNCGYENYKLIAIAFEPDLTGNQIKLYTVIGNTNITANQDSDYWYGDMLGTCDNQYVFETDAAEFIQNQLHEYFLSIRPTPPTGCRYFYVNNKYVSIPRTQLDASPDNYLDFDIFKASTEYNYPPSGTLDEIVKCLDYTDEILFYKSNYKQLIENQQVGGWVYNSCDVKGYYETTPWYTINHSLDLFLSIRLQECGQSEYPINISNEY